MKGTVAPSSSRPTAAAICAGFALSSRARRYSMGGSILCRGVLSEKTGKVNYGTAISSEDFRIRKQQNFLDDGFRNYEGATDSSTGSSSGIPVLTKCPAKRVSSIESHFQPLCLPVGGLPIAMIQICNRYSIFARGMEEFSLLQINSHMPLETSRLEKHEISCPQLAFFYM